MMPVRKCIMMPRPSAGLPLCGPVLDARAPPSACGGDSRAIACWWRAGMHVGFVRVYYSVCGDRMLLSSL